MGLTYVELLAKVPHTVSEFDELSPWFYAGIPGMSLLSTTPQDPIHHGEGDVWTHTQMVCRELVSNSRYALLSEEDRFIAFYAALLHDIAKPLCTVVDPVSGKISSAGHSKKGAIDARILLWDAGVPFRVRESICNIIAVHQVPFFALKDKSRSPEYLLNMLSVSLPIHLLLLVAEADMRGRVYDGMQDCLDDIAIFSMMAEELGVLNAPAAFADKVTRWRYFAGNGDIYPHTPFYRDAGSRVLVLSGLPAVGKNTFIESLNLDWPVLSFDDAKAELGLSEGDNVGSAVHAVLDRAKKLLAKGDSFIWNATHLTKQMRGKSLDLIHAYQGEVELVYLEHPRSVLLSRNANRDSSLTNKKLQEMTLKWDVPLVTEAHTVKYIVNNKEQDHGYDRF